MSAPNDILKENIDCGSRHSSRQGLTEREGQAGNLWRNTTERNLENRRLLSATKTRPGNERFIENSLAGGERTFRLHRPGSDAETNTNCGVGTGSS